MEKTTQSAADARMVSFVRWAKQNYFDTAHDPRTGVFTCGTTIVAWLAWSAASLAIASPAPGALADLRALSEAAKPGPWHTDWYPTYDEDSGAELAPVCEGICIHTEEHGTENIISCGEDEAAFIVAAVNHVRTLIASSPAASAPPVDGGERERIAQILYDHDAKHLGPLWTWGQANSKERAEYLDRADAILAHPRPAAGAVGLQPDQFDFAPALGASTPEPSIREIVRSYYRRFPDLIDGDKAEALTNDYLDALARHATPEGDLISYITRQWAWSKETFGPALRTKGIVQHITKELREIEAKPHDLSEWVDVIILAMDGFWRHGGKPEDLLPAMQAKQDKNFARAWPDWRTMGEDQAIEHDRSGDAIPQGVSNLGQIILEKSREPSFVELDKALGGNTTTPGFLYAFKVRPTGPETFVVRLASGRDLVVTEKEWTAATPQGAGETAGGGDEAEAFRDWMGEFEPSSSTRRAFKAGYAAALARPSAPADAGVTQFGWLFHNPDTGTEWSADNPIESGECPDAGDVRPATLEHLYDEMIGAWALLAQQERVTIALPAASTTSGGGGGG